MNSIATFFAGSILTHLAAPWLTAASGGVAFLLMCLFVNGTEKRRNEKILLYGWWAFMVLLAANIASRLIV